MQAWFKFPPLGRLCQIPYSLGTENSQVPVACPEGGVEIQNDQHISTQLIIQFMLDTSVAIFFFSKSNVTVTDFTQSKVKNM